MRPNDLRQEIRVEIELPVQISVGSQLTLQGMLKDISLKSAFITMKSSVYLKVHDEVGFFIQLEPGSDTKVIEGMARVSRIAVGDGMAIYFTEMRDKSTERLKSLLKQ
jgi:c-di-GMP-binding flagellar brake protein YcgR